MQFGRRKSVKTDLSLLHVGNPDGLLVGAFVGLDVGIPVGITVGMSVGKDL